VIDWERESFDLINDGHFSITKPGPLHAPVHSFSVQRDEKLRLILKTVAPANARSSEVTRSSGTVRLATDSVELTNVAGVKAVLRGVTCYSVNIANQLEANKHFLTEEATVHRIDIETDNERSPCYTIDWIDNVPAIFHWPDTIRTSQSTSTTRNIAIDDDGISLTTSATHESFSRHAVKLTVAGVDVFFCTHGRDSTIGRVRPGCIIYSGTPDGEFRKRLRNALSFSLGAYLVYLGHTTYSDDWRIRSVLLTSAYSIGKAVFDLPVLHPAPLHQSWQHGVERNRLHRMVHSILEKYDEIDFGSLAWAYWHALCATPHIAGVHFGAAIEALQRRYIEANATKVPTKIIADRPTWKKLNTSIEGLIADLNLPEELKTALRQNVGALNRVPQRTKMEALLKAIKIVLGPDEALAWKRRDDAAHGNEMVPGGELPLIQDNKLLKVVLHRILLSVTNASDAYFDYATPGFPVRKLSDPPSSLTSR
jgi:hypothetical protein